MNTFRITSNESFFTDVEVRLSDEYSGDAYITITRNDLGIGSVEVDKMFISPNQLDLLGRFLSRQAEDLIAAKKNKK